MTADKYEGLSVDAVVREDEADSSSSQPLGHSSCVSSSSKKPASSKTLQPHHNRPTDFVHRTRDAGVFI